LVISAICRDKLTNTEKPEFCRDPWLASGMHIALQIQKANQGLLRHKGKTFLVFDENKMKADALAELLWDAPEWTDDFYGRKTKKDRLDQLIDTVFTMKSHHAGLVQVADIYALVFRRYAELSDLGGQEEWNGEKALMEGYVRTLESRLLAKSTRWPSNPKGECAKWYNLVAPSSLLQLAN
jgi:hypothetical protein